MSDSSSVPTRVVQWSTGNVGTHALRCLIGHPDLELVGVIVHSDAKAGIDAGELCALPPTGVLTTTDIDAALALAPDVVCYTAAGDLRPAEAVDDMARALRLGIDVISTSVVGLVWPPTADPSLVATLDAACTGGSSTCLTSGIDPGLANDLMPLVLSGFCERIDSIRVMEILDYSTYEQASVLFDIMGFGGSLDETPLLLLPGVLTSAWGGVISMMATALGVELDEIREVHERRAATESFDISSGHVEVGTTAAMRFEIQGIVAGRPAIVVEHVTRLRDQDCPDWPRGNGMGSYRLIVEGSPRIECELTFEGADGDHNTGGLTATVMRLINAIPDVRSSPPGVISTLDLPLVVGRGLVSR